MALTLLGYPAHVRAKDHETGFRILGRADDRSRELSMTAAVWGALVGAATASTGLLVVPSFGGLFVLDALNAGSFTVGEPGTITFVFSYVNTPGDLGQHRVRNPGHRRAPRTGLLVRPLFPPPATDSSKTS